MKNLKNVLIAGGCILSSVTVLSAEPNIFWSQLGTLPSASGKDQQGLSGSFAGIHNNAMIIAGGSNFCGGLPWEGGKKTFWDTIFVCADGKWKKQEVTLPRPLCNGFSATTRWGVFCAGGADAIRSSTDAFLLRWNPRRQKVEVVRLPSLPEPLTLMGGSEAGGCVFIVGGRNQPDSPIESRHAYMMDLNRVEVAGLLWKRLPDFPGDGRVLPVSFALAGGSKPGFYVFGGRAQRPGALPRLFSDGYHYDPDLHQWERKGNLLGAHRASLTAAETVVYHNKGAYVFGGDDSVIFSKLQNLAIAINRDTELLSHSKNEEEKERARRNIERSQRQKQRILETHPGFSRNVYFYHPDTDSWRKIGYFPHWPPVSTSAFWWGDKIILPSGEIHPGVRSQVIWQGVVRASREVK